MHERRVRVMGSDAVVVVVGGRGELADAAIARLHDLERRWSRFLPDSEISRANAAAGRDVAVSAATLALVERAEMARARTDGRFDPTQLHQVVDAGYDRDLSMLTRVPVALDDAFDAPADATARADATVPPSPSAAPPAPARARAVHVDRRAGTIRVPEGSGFDPGGIGKGWAADLVAGELLGEGAAGVCVSVGGDLRVAGPGPGGDPWHVQIEDPRDPDGRALLTLSLTDGAVATSSRMRRRWVRADGRIAHHLIDPRTGRPASTPVLSCTVVAAECWQAEALTKVAFVSPVPELFELLDESGGTGVVVTRDRVAHAPGLAPFTVPAARAHR